MSLCTTSKRPALGASMLNEAAIAMEETARPAKRQRTDSLELDLEADLLTPPNGPEEEEKQLQAAKSTVSAAQVQSGETADSEEEDSILSSAINVLAVEAAALAATHNLYRTNAVAKQGLLSAVRAIVQCRSNRGKLIVTGVGKSGYIAQKLVASCKSLGIPASFMHACEAAHGDLGDIREHDLILFITYSANTPELINLLPHIPSSTTLLALTSHTTPSTCPLFLSRAPESCILLPAPIPIPESVSFGVSAPTTSTTVALAVADMLALTVAERVHGREGMGKVFGRNHPGGAIGVAVRKGEAKFEGERETQVEGGGLLSPGLSGSDDG